MATASIANVSAHTPAQSSSRTSKRRGTRKRSTSSPFASLFATLTSFSSSSTSAAVAPVVQGSAISRTSSALQTTANGQRDRGNLRHDALNKSMPASKDASSKALVRRAITPAKQAVVLVKTATRPTTSSSKPLRPNVFSFQNGSSRPPSPRPRNSSSSKLTPKSPRKSVDLERIYSSPIPVRPVTVPSVTTMDDSYSDSGLTTSETPSPPDTPSPSDRRVVASEANKSSPTGSLQDAVGRSFHAEDFYKSKRHSAAQLQKRHVPPEAPTAPHVHQSSQASQSTHTLRAASSSYDYLSSPVHQTQTQPTYFPYAMTLPPGSNMYHSPTAISTSQNPHPTPPLEYTHSTSISDPDISYSHPQSPHNPQHSHGQSLQQSRSSQQPVPRRPVPKDAKPADWYPRQYAQLTQHMIRRCESVINHLEEDLAHLDRTTGGRDGSPGVWHRDQLVMKLSNVIIMHHRLIDTWSKIASFPKAINGASNSSAVAAKLDSIRESMRLEFEPYRNLQGVDIDGAIAHTVSDLIQIGESLRGSGGSGGINSADRQSLAWLFGAILVLMMLQDGFGVKSAAVGVGMVGVWRWVRGGGGGGG